MEVSFAGGGPASGSWLRDERGRGPRSRGLPTISNGNAPGRREARRLPLRGGGDGGGVLGGGGDGGGVLGEADLARVRVLHELLHHGAVDEPLLGQQAQEDAALAVLDLARGEGEEAVGLLLRLHDAVHGHLEGGAVVPLEEGEARPLDL